MFNVRFTRALLSACTVEAFLHAARAAAAAPTPSQTACRLSYYASFFTWQRASAFNQPLSLDTSSVTTMQYMFNVRFTRALPSASTVGAFLHAACAAGAPRGWGLDFPQDRPRFPSNPCHPLATPLTTLGHPEGGGKIRAQGGKIRAQGGKGW